VPTITEIVLAVSTLLSVIVSGAAFWISLRKAPAEIKRDAGAAAESISKAWETLNEPLLKRVETLEAQNADLARRLDLSQQEIADLKSKLAGTEAALADERQARRRDNEQKDQEIRTLRAQVAVLEHRDARGGAEAA